jgi:hypothetical protein
VSQSPDCVPFDRQKCKEGDQRAYQR